MKKADKKSGYLRIILSAVIIVALIIAITVMITNNGKFTIDGFRNLLQNVRGDSADEFYFEPGVDNAFADINGGLAVATSVGIQCFNKNGEETIRETFLMSNPAIVSSGGTAVAYDIGGTELRVFDANGVKLALTAENPIISATLNSSGWLALCTQARGYKGMVTVYNNKGVAVYKWYSGEGYVLSAAVSPGNTGMAALTLTESGSRIVFFNFNSEDELSSYVLSGELLLEIKYISDNKIFVVGENLMLTVDNSGNAEKIFEYPDEHLNVYSIDSGDFTAVVLSEFHVGGTSRIVTIGKNGAVLSELNTRRAVLSVSAAGEKLAVLQSDGLRLYNMNLEELAVFEGAAGFIQAIMRLDGKALAVSAHLASVYSIKK